MLDPRQVVNILRDAGVGLFTGVPDSLLKDFNAAIATEVPFADHIPAPNEGNAVAIAAGNYLATGRLGLVYLQNAGLGNTLNPLASLTDPSVYGIPMILMIGWRGEPGRHDEPQHRLQGNVTVGQLELLEIPWARLPDEPQAARELLIAEVGAALRGDGPRALLVSAGTFAKNPAEPSPERSHISRMDAIAAILDALPDTAGFVATTGFTGRELDTLRLARGEPSNDLLIVGAMGHASAVALGVALGTPGRLICCLDGDGAMAMHMGMIASIARTAPQNLLHVLLNNGVHDSVGGQPSVLDGARPGDLARAAGYPTVVRTSDLVELEAALKLALDGPRPAFIEVDIAPGAATDLARPSEPLQDRGEAFSRHLRG